MALESMCEGGVKTFDLNPAKIKTSLPPNFYFQCCTSTLGRCAGPRQLSQQTIACSHPLSSINCYNTFDFPIPFHFNSIQFHSIPFTSIQFYSIRVPCLALPSSVSPVLTFTYSGPAQWHLQTSLNVSWAST